MPKYVSLDPIIQMVATLDGRPLLVNYQRPATHPQQSKAQRRDWKISNNPKPPKR